MKLQPKRLTAPHILFSISPEDLGAMQASSEHSEGGKPRLSTVSELNVPRVTPKYCPCLEIALNKHSNCLILSLHLNV